MNSKRLYYAMLGILVLMIVGLVGGAYGIDALLSAESNRLVDARLHVTVLEHQQDQLFRAKQDIQKYKGLATIARNVVPQDKDQAQTINQIVAIAVANGVSLSSITFPTSSLGAATKANGPNLSQLTPVTDITGVYSLHLSVQADPAKPVAYSKFLSFLDALEHNRRTALVQSVTILPNDKDRNTLSFTLVLDEYIKP